MGLALYSPPSQVIGAEAAAPFSSSKSVIFYCVSIALASVLRFSPEDPNSLKDPTGDLRRTVQSACLTKKIKRSSSSPIIISVQGNTIYPFTYARNLGNILHSTFCILYNQSLHLIVQLKKKNSQKMLPLPLLLAPWLTSPHSFP